MLFCPCIVWGQPTDSFLSLSLALSVSLGAAKNNNNNNNNNNRKKQTRKCGGGQRECVRVCEIRRELRCFCCFRLDLLKQEETDMGDDAKIITGASQLPVIRKKRWFHHNNRSIIYDHHHKNKQRIRHACVKKAREKYDRVEKYHTRIILLEQNIVY